MGVSVDGLGQERFPPAGVVMVMVGRERECVSRSPPLIWLIIGRLLGDASRIPLLENRLATQSCSMFISSSLFAVSVGHLRLSITLEEAAVSFSVLELYPFPSSASREGSFTCKEQGFSFFRLSKV